MKARSIGQETGGPQVDLDARIDEAIAACDGDARVAVRALLVLTDHLPAELASRDAAVGRLAEGISRGFMRGRW